jgi:hypothetical protein
MYEVESGILILPPIRIFTGVVREIKFISAKTVQHLRLLTDG